MRVPLEFDEAMVEAPKPEPTPASAPEEFSPDATEIAGREVDLHQPPPRHGSDAYYDAFSEEIDRRPIGVPRGRRRGVGPLD